MSKITQEALSILKNSELISINQDPVVGTAITPFRWGINVRPTFSHLWYPDLIFISKYSLTGRLTARTLRNIGVERARMGQ